MKLRAASATDIGRIRSANQDCALVEANLVAVADGMGGHAGGEVAARMAIAALERSFQDRRGVGGLVAAAEEANREVRARSERDQDLRGMGTTLTAAALVSTRHGERVALINVGDSRAYLFDGERLSRLTDDHSLVEEMLRSGEITADQAAVHPHRHILTRALGIDRRVEIDSWLLEPMATARLLICSDGLTNECSEEEIAAILRDRADPAEAASQLVAAALAHGGNDNVTVVVADVVDDAKDPHALETAGGAERGDKPAPPKAATRRAPTARVAATASAVTAGAAVPRAARPPAPGRRPSPPNPPPRRARRAYRERRFTPGVFLFVLLLLGVLGGAAGFVVWFVKATYFVGVRRGDVAIFQGRPGGFLWFQPTLVEQTSLSTTQVFPPAVPLLRTGILESSYASAKRVVSNLSNSQNFLALPGAATTATTTTITATTTTIAATTTSGARSSIPTTTTRPAGGH